MYFRDADDKITCKTDEIVEIIFKRSGLNYDPDDDSSYNLHVEFCQFVNKILEQSVSKIKKLSELSERFEIFSY